DGRLPLNDFLRRIFARSIAWYEDLAFFQGTGTGQPLGILKAASTVLQARNTPAHFKIQDPGTMSADLLPASRSRAVWAVSPTAWADRRIEGLSGAGWQLTQPWGDAHYILNGRRGYVPEKLPALGTLGDVMLFDPSLYVIGQRGLEIDVSRDEPTA